jgi:heptosyltransferase II
LPTRPQPLPEEVRLRFQALRVTGVKTCDPDAVRRVLVRAPNWLGDAVMSLPVFSGLRRLFPQGQITVLAAPRVAPLFTGQPGVSDIIAYPPGPEKWRLLRGLRGRFDLGLALPNSLESALGLFLARVPVRVGYQANLRRPFLTRPVAGRRTLAGLHTVYYLLGLLRAFGEVPAFTPPTLHLQAADVKAAEKLLSSAGRSAAGPWVGLSPGAAYGPAKRWPPERFAALADHLEARIVLLGSTEDQEAAEMVKAHLRRPALDLVGRTNLRQALAVLSRLRLLVTNDSGLMHAAAALGVPLVAIFGSTDPVATGPFAPQATVLHHPLPCAPCFQRTCGEGYPCLTAITVAQVAEAARHWLKEGA